MTAFAERGGKAALCKRRRPGWNVGMQPSLDLVAWPQGYPIHSSDPKDLRIINDGKIRQCKERFT